MNKTTVYKILICIFILSLIAILTVCLCLIKKSDATDDTGDITDNAFLTGQEWSCETINGVPCGGSTTISNVGRKDYIYFGKTSWTCTDRNKQEMESFTVPRMFSGVDNFTAIAKCMDLNYMPHLPLTPCIIDFTVCIEDPRVPAVALTCRYLKDFRQIDDQYSLEDFRNATCGTNGTVYTYYMDTGYSITTIEYSNNVLRFEKPVLPEKNNSSDVAMQLM